LIQIARHVRLGIFDTEVQALKVGEIYRVAPAIGIVLVSEGWAEEVETSSGGHASALDRADDDPSNDPAGS
jgi:hypothetical protein